MVVEVNLSVQSFKLLHSIILSGCSLVKLTSSLLMDDCFDAWFVIANIK